MGSIIHVLEYFDSLVKITLQGSREGGTQLQLDNERVPDNKYLEMYSGWVSVLMNLKSVADFEVDLRNHDPEKTWDHGFADN